MKALTLLMFALAAYAQQAPYKVLRTVKVGGAGGFDYLTADPVQRRLYVPRSGDAGHVMVFNLDTLAPAGDIPAASARGVAISQKSGHGFVGSKPVQMFDLKTLAVLKKIDVEGAPDGMYYDAFNDRVYVFSHREPHVTAINGADGSVVGTVNIGGLPEQAAPDGKGLVYIDVEDKANVAVLDGRTLKVTGHYDVTGKGDVCAGLALDRKSGVLFAACRNPQNMVILNSKDGRVIATLPIGAGSDGTVINPKTREVFASHGDGTLSIVKQQGPNKFVLAQTLKTMVSAKTLTFDPKTGHIFLIAAEFGPTPPGGRGRGPLVADSFSIIEVGR